MSFTGFQRPKLHPHRWCEAMCYGGWRVRLAPQNTICAPRR